MGLKGEAARLKRRLHRTPEQRELRRLWALPDYQPGVTRLLGSPFAFTFGRSLVMQYRAIFEQHAYSFDPSRQDPVIYDCGANIGVAIRYWKQLWPHTRIVAFEADPQIAAVLRQNVDSRDNTIDVVEAAVWSADTTLSFVPNGGDAGRLGNGDLRIRAVRLRDCLAVEPHVDLLKLDIEGAETEVLTDCAEVMDGVDRVFVEYHSFADQPQTLPELLSVLKGAGYRLQIRDEWASPTPFIAWPKQYGMDLQLNIWAYRARTHGAM